MSEMLPKLWLNLNKRQNIDKFVNFPTYFFYSVYALVQMRHRCSND